MEDTKNYSNTEKERITLEYTAKGFANWTISLKDDLVSSTTIERLEALDKLMRDKFPQSVIGGLQ